MSAGVTFDERMDGFVVTSARVPEDAADYREAYGRARKEGRACHFEATMLIDDIAAYVRDPQHRALMTGKFRWGSGEPASMRDGEFQLHVKNPETGIREMRYRFDFTGPDGEPLRFTGVKWMKPKWRIGTWGASTTLYSRIERAAGAQQEGRGWSGILTIGVGETLKLLRSVRPVGAADRSEGRRAVYAFNRFFMREQLMLLREG